MKRNNSKKDSSAKQQTIVLVGNTYRRNVNPIPVIAVKLVLAYMLTVGTVMSFINIYDIPFEFGSAIAQVLLFVTAFMPVFIFIKKRYALPAFAVGAAIVYFFFHKSINESLILFKDYIFIQLDSRLLSTLQYVPVNSHAFLTRTQDFVSGMNTAMLILTCIISFICVLCCYKKFHPIAVIVTWSVMFIPSFMSEDADYSVYILLAATAFFGLLAINSANGFYSQVPVNNANGAKNKPSNDEKAFRKNLRKKNPLQTAKSELSRYSRNCLCGILAAVITFGATFGSQKLFPDMSYIDTENIINSTIKFFTDIGEYFSLAFSGNAGGLFNGYFSSDNFLINNNIELNAPPQSANEPVLKVRSTYETGMYLVGDIGVDFTGKSWVSIKKKVGKDELYSGEYNISDSFSPEKIAQVEQYMRLFGGLTQKTLTSADYSYIYEHSESPGYAGIRLAMEENDFSEYRFNPNFMYSSQSVSIEYLKNTSIVFKPFLPDNNAYMKNENFNYYGDTIIRIADRKNWMKSFETNVLIPANIGTFVFADDATTDSDKASLLYSLGFGSYSDAMTYIEDKKEYDRYVRNTYTTVPENEKENIRRFLDEFEGKDGDNAGTVDNELLYVYGMCEYLRSHYAYSLTADNTSDKSNTMLGNFLFGTKQGHCALYASAMTLALREKGIPARYITGFTTGKLEFNESTGMYEKTIHENSLHAWVEVYTEDFGWLPFDPTGYGGNSITGDYIDPSQTDTPVTTAPPQTTSTTVTTTVSPSQPTATTPPVTSASSDDSSDNSGNNPGSDAPGKTDYSLLIKIALAVIGVIALTALIFAFIRSVKRKNENRMKSFRKSKNTVSAVKDMYGFIMKLFGTTDLVPCDNELPLEFAVRADEKLKTLGTDTSLVRIMSIIEKAEFSNEEISEQERAEVYLYTKQLYALVLQNSGRIKRMWIKVTF